MYTGIVVCEIDDTSKQCNVNVEFLVEHDFQVVFCDLVIVIIRDKNCYNYRAQRLCIIYITYNC